MNKFKEFDCIKTPKSWKNIDLNQNLKSTTRSSMIYKLVLSAICFIIVFSSFGLVYAYNETFRLWLHQQFQNSEVDFVPEFNMEKTWRYENGFIYYYHEDNNQEIIDEVQVFKDGKFQQERIKLIEGVYQSQEFSFNYVRNQDKIITFNEKGFFRYSVPTMKGDIVYFGSITNNLCSLDLKTRRVTEITHDQESVNFSISPEKTYILINKSDKYWTVYNTMTNVEKRLDQLNPYALNNEYGFLDDSHLVIFGKNDNTAVINLETFYTNQYDKQCIYPDLSTLYLTYQKNETLVTNVINNQTYLITHNLEGYNYAIFKNRYIIFESFDKKQIVIIDFKERKTKVLDFLGTDEDVRISFLTDDYFMISNQQSYYLLQISNIFE